MFDLALTASYLDGLSENQDDAANTAGSAARTASGIETSVWVTHGVVSGASNIAFAEAEAARRAAGGAMKKFSADLAVKLRTADEAYQRTDEQAGNNIDRQMPPR
jgi:hypothetical protein